MKESEKSEKHFDFYQLKNICERKVLLNRNISSELFGYTREQLRAFVERPYRHSNKLISVMRFLYFHSGYFRKVIQYYIELVKSECWTVDTEFLSDSANKVKKENLKRDYFAYVKKINSFDLPNELPKILFNVFMYDAYFGYIIDTDDGKTLFAFQPEDCIITGYVNGIPCFSVKKLSTRDSRLRQYPKEVANFLQNAATDSMFKGYVDMPYKKTICIKYNDGFDFLYPPFAFIIKEILDLEDFKDIEKTKAENDVYKLIAAKIPTDQNGRPTLSDKDTTPFYQLAVNILADSIGMLPTPFDVTPIEFSTNTANNINNVKNATDEMYSELGISQALLSGASSGSELKLSVEVDASEVYRVLKQVAKAMNFHCRMSLPQNSKYRFAFRYLDITAHNQNERVDELFKLAQASCPVKSELMAAVGNNPLKMFGNTFMENEVFGLSDNWVPMKTAYTQSADSENNGRLAMKEDEISDITQNTRDNEGNDRDNRI